jgi:ATP-dependent Clp protease adaptor protein ClpS
MSDSTMQPRTKATVQVFPRESTTASTVSMSTVLIHNDEVTPYEYVINILADLFMLSEELADHVAWTAHTKGVAVVVVRPRVEAEKLVTVARGRARSSGYPLTFTLEQN